MYYNKLIKPKHIYKYKKKCTTCDVTALLVIIIYFKYYIIISIKSVGIKSINECYRISWIVYL